MQKHLLGSPVVVDLSSRPTTPPEVFTEPSLTVDVEARFNTVVDEFADYLRNIITKLCPKDLGLEHTDIEQEARIRLWRALQSGTEIRDLASYIYRIAANTTIDAIRRVKARREEQLRTAADDQEQGTFQADSLVAGPHASPDSIAERRQTTGRVRGAFARLAEDRRRAVVLHLEGFTTEEIAHSQGWSEPRARHLVYRGMHDLRRQLTAEGIECETD